MTLQEAIEKAKNNKKDRVNDPDYVICYKDIKQIGPDIIIVDICKKG